MKKTQEIPGVTHWKRIIIAVAFGATALTAGSAGRTPVLKAIRAEGKLVVLTRNGPTTYYEGRDGPDGFEYALATRYARSLGVEAQFRVFHSVEELLAAFRRGEGQLAAAGITRTRARERRYRFGPEYFRVRQEVVCRRGGPMPASPEALSEMRLRVPAGTSYAERLRALKAEVPGLHWEEVPGAATEQLLRQVWNRELDCTVADSNIFAVIRRYMPELQVAFSLSGEQQLAWVLADDSGFAESVGRWFDEAERRGVTKRLRERYYGYTEIFDYVDLRIFMRRIDERLPRFAASFRAAADNAQLPWTLLAAQAYQESHWNPRAKSPTGVRGIMMLTQLTASELGVENRMHPEQSIRGGAKYLARLIRRLPESVRGQDRYWFALAAYNVGYGHLRDARALARRLGKNPDRWVDLKEILPLLSETKYYKTLPHGYARGWEPVEYVQRIRDYRDVLEQRLTAAEAVETTEPTEPTAR